MKIWSLVTSSCSSTPACRESEWRCLVDKSTGAAASGCCSAARYADCRVWVMQIAGHCSGANTHECINRLIHKLWMYLQCYNVYLLCVLMSSHFLHISICNTSSFIIWDFRWDFYQVTLEIVCNTHVSSISYALANNIRCFWDISYLARRCFWPKVQPAVGSRQCSGLGIIAFKLTGAWHKLQLCPTLPQSNNRNKVFVTIK